MVIVLQILIFAIAFAFRGRFLFGMQLKVLSGSDNLTYIGRRKHGIVSRHIGVTQENGIPFIIKRERWYHAVFKALGIAAEINVGNDAFDTKYFITTDHPSHLEEALRASAMISDLQALFQLPIKSVHATPSKIWCICKRDDLEESESHYDRHRELLSSISERAQKSSLNENLANTRRYLGLLALIVLAVHAGLVTLGIFGALPTFADFIYTLEVESLLAKGALGGLTAAGVWLLALLAVFARSSWVCWVLVDFMLCGLIGFALSGIIILREANINLPQAPATVVASMVTQKTCTINCSKRCGKHCTRRSYYPYQGDTECAPEARVAALEYRKQTDYICNSNANFSYKIHTSGWPGMPQYSFTSRPSLFDAIQQGSTLAVPINPGAAGLKWIDTDTIQPAGQTY